MAFANILIGDLPNDGTGDALRVAFSKINNNFSIVTSTTELGGNVGSYQFKTTANINGVISNISTGSNSLINDATNVVIATNFIPNGVVNLGSNTNPFQNIYVGNSIAIGNITLSTTANSLNFTGNISPTNLNVTNTFSFGTTVQVNNSSVIFITNDNTSQTAYQLPLSQVRTARFEITSVETTSQSSQFSVVEATKQNNNGDVKYTIHSSVFVGTVLTTFDVTAEFGQLKLNVMPFANTTINHSIVIKLTN